MKRYGQVFRSLSSMHRAGIPWPRAVESASGGDPGLVAVTRALDGGSPLSEAFAPHVDPLTRALLEAGERDGSLEQVFDELAEAEEQRGRERKQEWSAILYPVVLAHVAALLMPLPDLVQGNVGGALFWFLLILVPTWLFLAWRLRWSQRERPVPGTGEPPLPTTLPGPWLSGVELADARALDALGRLYDAGVPVADALDLAIQAGWGGRAAVDLAEARRRARRGLDLAGAWRLLPADLAQRLRAAEEAGSLGEAMRRVADGLRFDVQTRRKRIAALLPVVMILIVGGIIAWRLFSFYAGYYGRFS